MANPEKGKGSKAPSRAASLQRMLEMERKQKMERMQQDPFAPGPGRRDASPASRSKPNLLTRRRDTSQPPPNDDRRMSTVRNFTLPPLSIHTEPRRPLRVADLDKPAKQPEPKTAPLNETKKPDRDSLPSMMRAAADHGPSNLKTVTFVPSEDGDMSETSSICHSPTWHDYGKKKRRSKEKEKKKEKEREALAKDPRSAKRRLTKEPPPVSMDKRPTLNSRAMSAPLLDQRIGTTSLESVNGPNQPSGSTQTDTPQRPFLHSQSASVESVQTVVRSPGFIGGVRLERERESALKRLINSRASSVERPASELQQEHMSQSGGLDGPKNRETAPPVSYPPTASKTPFLKQALPGKGHTRTRSGSFSNVLSSAAKMFTSSKQPQTSEPYSNTNGSQESVQTVQTLQSSNGRGRGRSGSTVTHSRAQSHDGHNRSAESPNGRRGAFGLPPLSWKTMRMGGRTLSMMPVPPDSARDSSSSSNNSPEMKKDDFGFLDQPFSPASETPLSPPGSLPASMKDRISPRMTPNTGARRVSEPPRKTFKETLKAGFRSSASPETEHGHRRAMTDDAVVGTGIHLPLGVQPPQSYATPGPSTNDHPALRARGVQGSGENNPINPIGRTQAAVNTKDSGASSSSSHLDSESTPPSPMTTPETSRPQSKDNQDIRFNDVRKTPLVSTQEANGQVSRKSTAAALAEQFSSSPWSQGNSPRIQIDRSSGSSDETNRLQKGSGSHFAEDVSSQSIISDELWPRSKKPLDIDQLSFTSALTSLDVKRSSTTNLGLASPNSDVEPLSLERDHKDAKETKVTLRQLQVETTQRPAGLKNRRASETPPTSSNTSFLPTLRHQALPPRPSARPGAALSPSSEVDQRSVSSPGRTESPASAATYLQEARKAAPASPRTQIAIKTNGSSASPSTSLAPANTRSFALTNAPRPSSLAAMPIADASTSSPLSCSLPAIFSPKSVDTAALLGKPLAGKPIAKMLVECCSCKFFQDMPSRVYAAMTQPDDVVKDKRLGVSGQVTTCVKCPWCSHNMSTACCAGYAAVVYLREKMHGP